MSWGPLLVNLAATAGLVAVLMLASFGLSAGSGVAGRRVLVLVTASQSMIAREGCV